METVTVASLMTNVASVFSSAVTMVGTVVTTICANPLLLIFSIVGLTGIGVGLFNRLVRG